jgi:hypothetical protein
MKASNRSILFFLFKGERPFRVGVLDFTGLTLTFSDRLFQAMTSLCLALGVLAYFYVN